MNYAPASTRYDQMAYRQCGRSGLKLPALSLGLWHNFGDDVPFETSRAICRRAFDLGITHFDLANNYGPPPGAAEKTFAKILRTDFSGHRDELVISTKAGYLMWPGPYGEFGSRKYMLASLDQSLKRLGLDYVDIFYSHRFDPATPLEETMGALATAVDCGKALYVGVSSYSAARTADAAAILRSMGITPLIHQPSYSMLNRWIESDHLLDRLATEGMGCIAFTPLGQGLLTNKYVSGVPAGSRATANKSLRPEFINEQTLTRIKGLNLIAQRRGQSLAQMAIAWVLRDPRMTTALIGASRPEQVEDCVGALANLHFDDIELSEIDQYAVDSNVNLWSASSSY
jgi:L-glyceraldehyde 3-phosphate reductase